MTELYRLRQRRDFRRTGDHACGKPSDHDLYRQRPRPGGRHAHFAGGGHPGVLDSR